MNHNLFDTFASKMQARGTANFITTPEGAEYSHAQALAKTERMAGALKALGVAPGDRVAVQVDKSPEAILLYLATLRVGGVYLPLNTGYTADEIGYFLGDAEPALFVCQPAALEAAKAIAEKTGCPQVQTLGTHADGSLMDAVAAADAYTGIEQRDEDDLAAILYTSGTTGRSKGAMLTHTNLGSNCKSLVEAWRFTEKDRLIHALPIFHTHGLFVACNVILMAGASLYFMAKFDVDTIIAAMPQGTSLMGVPTFYTRLLQDDRLTPELTANMRLFTSGSAPLTAETHQQFEQRTGHAILERYGMTETNMNTSNPYDGDRIAGTVGMPLPGVEIRITDPESSTHESLPQGEIGMLEVRGPNVFKGYWRMPEKTKAELLEDGFFVTGDLALVDDRGYVQIVGRDKDLVISGGFNVYPKEVEQAIDEMPEVLESAVIGVPHPDFGEGVTAVVVLQPGKTLEEGDVVKSLADHLAKYKQPKRVFFVEALPRNTMGKVQKKQLRDEYKDIYAGA
ncbi:MAG: malonyl-CoA synthase [Pseudomonadota bacterium]|nr:malonyl-CoA synthase [Pseudomonadota bacterium]MEE3116742.1 malonyl-CoA synthase [Pseudomonadota bacterium]